MKVCRTIAIVIAFLLVGGFCFATDDALKVKVIQPQKSYVPGKDYPIAFKIEIPKGLMVHGHKTPPDQMLIPTNLSFDSQGNVVIDQVRFPVPQQVKLAYSEEPVEAYRGEILVTATLHIGQEAQPSTYEIKGTLTYQACTLDSCFPPKKEPVTVSVNVVPTGTKHPSTNAYLLGEGSNRGKGHKPVTVKGFRFHGGLLLTLIAIFLGGLALNLTPCIYPLIPITISFFGARSAQLRGRKMLHGAMYIVGLAVTNSILGVSAALTGGMLGTALQNPIVIIIVSGIILAMGLSFFGFWEIRLPSGMVNMASRGFGGFFGSFFMGLTLGVVAAPCLGPFVLGLLTYVGQKGDPFLGFLYFFVLSLGLGLPLGVLAVSSGAVDKLPMSGNWLLWIKKGFGWALVAMAAFMIRPLLPGNALKITTLAAVLVAAAIHIGFLDKTQSGARSFQIIKRVVGIVLLLVAGFMVSGLFYSANGIKWVPYRPGILEEAKRLGRPVMLDFSAQWCTPCREMEDTTFRDQTVVSLASNLMAVRVDLTIRKPDTDKVVKQFDIRGVPTLVFLRPNGEEDRLLRVQSYISSEELAKRIRAVLSQSSKPPR